MLWHFRIKIQRQCRQVSLRAILAGRLMNRVAVWLGSLPLVVAAESSTCAMSCCATSGCQLKQIASTALNDGCRICIGHAGFGVMAEDILDWNQSHFDASGCNRYASGARSMACDMNERDPFVQRWYLQTCTNFYECKAMACTSEGCTCVIMTSHSDPGTTYDGCCPGFYEQYGLGLNGYHSCVPFPSPPPPVSYTHLTLPTICSV